MHSDNKKPRLRFLYSSYALGLWISMQFSNNSENIFAIQDLHYQRHDNQKLQEKLKLKMPTSAVKLVQITFIYYLNEFYHLSHSTPEPSVSSALQNKLHSDSSVSMEETLGRSPRQNLQLCNARVQCNCKTKSRRLLVEKSISTKLSPCPLPATDHLPLILQPILHRNVLSCVYEISIANKPSTF